MIYDTFKYNIFKIVNDSSRSWIETYLKKLSNDFDIPYNKVVDDFNEYNLYLMNIEHKESE